VCFTLVCSTPSIILAYHFYIGENLGKERRKETKALSNQEKLAFLILLAI
jgi:hypothetical protein